MSDINWDAAKFFVDLVYLLGVIAVGVYAWIISRSKVNTEAIVEVDGRLNDHEVRIVRLEEYDRHAPNREDIEQLHTRVSNVKDAVNEVGEKMANLSGVLSGMKRSVDRLNDYHMNRGKE